MVSLFLWFPWFPEFPWLPQLLWFLGFHWLPWVPKFCGSLFPIMIVVNPRNSENSRNYKYCCFLTKEWEWKYGMKFRDRLT